MLMFSRYKVEESDLYLVIVSALLELLNTQKENLNDKILYYSLSILGTIAWASKEGKQNIIDLFDDELKQIVDTARNKKFSQATGYYYFEFSNTMTE